ncbi:ABC transporter ATP-binding protein [Bacillus salacetis]|uniref:ABC transporter ATP-binding protein n=1 Tax=Bacillus salacetis TaxID=2315464 RepID=UPI003BA03FB7
MFRLENISYYEILDSVTMELKKNVVSCITGPSGAGKSTILKFLNKMLIPTEGEIFYQDQPLQSIDSIELRRQAVMLQQAPVIFDGSIEENLQIGLKFAGEGPAQRNVLKDALDLVLLEKSLNEEADKLSGGEKQRLALARIFIMKPKVYLLDEPTSALDPETEIQVMKRFLKAVKEQNGTVIMVTHSKTISEKLGEENFYIEQKGKGR